MAHDDLMLSSLTGNFWGELGAELFQLWRLDSKGIMQG